MIIRPYAEADRPAIVRLHTELQTYERAFRPSRASGAAVSEAQVAEYEAMLADEDAALFVAEEDGAPIGYAVCLAEAEAIEYDPSQVYVQDIIVTETARGRGAGRALMNAVRAFADERGIGRLDLQVLVGNEAARGFYEALGFEVAYLGLKTLLPREAPA